jgi:hypothetical protein
VIVKEKPFAMKTLKIFLAIAFLTGFSSFTVALAQGQTSGGTSGDASITLVEITEVTKLTDLFFGNIIPQGSGSVIINTSGNRSTTGNVSVFGTVFSAARFEIIGGAGQSFSISNLPASITLKSPQNHTMTVSGFGVHPGSGQLGNDGKITVTVGATLQVNANQASGMYTNDTDLIITVYFQ